MEPLDIFIKDSKKIDVKQEFIRYFALNEKELVPNEHGLITFLRNDIEFSILGQHDLEDDYGIPFSDYPIQIYLSKLQEGESYETYESQYLEIGKYLTEKIAKKLNCRTMLVKNLSKTILSF
jgi:hypothetical protein